MKNKLFRVFCVSSICATLMLTLSGCGSQAPVSGATDQDSQQQEIENITGDTTSTDDQDSIPEDDSPEIYESVFETGSDRDFNATQVGMEITGIEEFESIKSDLYEDKPADGNVFVVLYIDLNNYNLTPYYFYPDYCEFTVDGQKTNTTFLVNEPKEGYETIFGYVDHSTAEFWYDRRGFLVIEAPKDWKNLEFKYTGWQYEDFGSYIVTNRFTRADLEKSE